MQATFDFELTEEVFVKAKVEPVKAVNLWLGANVMLEYSLEDATHLLVSLSLASSNPPRACPIFQMSISILF